ncbi:hypothetical protein [Dietzia cercidiphylli]|uniref:hypothetical protein n=1 Tax=Dietzia cercidiphylli TaxID=498199 RepID=UPI00223B7A56|nr:hypothetical protein [Dietzia cercidiphylli]MCT1514876.1 hypothetical protein [Dietzia cercidiphylli]
MAATGEADVVVVVLVAVGAVVACFDAVVVVLVDLEGSVLGRASLLEEGEGDGLVSASDGISSGG